VADGGRGFSLDRADRSGPAANTSTQQGPRPRSVQRRIRCGIIVMIQPPGRGSLCALSKLSGGRVPACRRRASHRRADKKPVKKQPSLLVPTPPNDSLSHSTEARMAIGQRCGTRKKRFSSRLNPHARLPLGTTTRCWPYASKAMVSYAHSRLAETPMVALVSAAVFSARTELRLASREISCSANLFRLEAARAFDMTCQDGKHFVRPFRTLAVTARRL